MMEKISLIIKCLNRLTFFDKSADLQLSMKEPVTLTWAPEPLSYRSKLVSLTKVTCMGLFQEKQNVSFSIINY